MIRFLTIGFLLVYLISFTECKELLRIPILFEHYAEHRNQVEGMSFLEFLVMHYETDIPHDDRDMSLPFKDSSHSAGSLIIFPVQKLSLAESNFVDDKDYQSFYLQHKPQLISSDIFQPPRI